MCQAADSCGTRVLAMLSDVMCSGAVGNEGRGMLVEGCRDSFKLSSCVGKDKAQAVDVI